MTASTAYSRAWRLPGPVGERRLMRTLTSKMEPKKLGVGVIAGCCLALLTYVSLAKLFAIYSPVLASTANTSALMQQQHTSPPSKSSSRPSVPETEAIPPQEETLAATGGANDGSDGAVDPVNDGLPEAEAAAGDGGSSEEEEPGASGRLFPADDSVVVVNKEEKRKEVAAVLGEEPGMKPRLLIVSRRALLKNLDEVSAAASELGFNVTALTTLSEPEQDVPAAQVAVNSADVLLAIQGAGLTADHIAFLPTKAVVVQIVPPPWGWRKTATDGNLLYGLQPDMQLRYLEYKVGEEEMSTLQSWQDVSVNINKLRPSLLQALDRLQE